MYKAVIFDLDGTLLDTLDDIAGAVNYALTERGCPGHPARAYRDFVGDGMLNTLRRALPQGRRDEDAIQACLQSFRAQYQRQGDPKTHPYEGVAAMLTALHERGTRMAILSNKPHQFAMAAAARHLADYQFDLVLGQRDGVPHKPDPHGALEIAGTLNIPPAEFLFVGDMMVDVETAARAGMFSVGVGWGFRPLDELRDADALIEKPTDLPRLLDGHGRLRET